MRECFEFRETSIPQAMNRRRNLSAKIHEARRLPCIYHRCDGGFTGGIDFSQFALNGSLRYFTLSTVLWIAASSCSVIWLTPFLHDSAAGSYPNKTFVNLLEHTNDPIHYMENLSYNDYPLYGWIPQIHLLYGV